MPQFNVHEAKTQFSHLLDLVLQGEEIVITRNGSRGAELVPVRKRGLTLGAWRHDPAVNTVQLDSLPELHRDPFDRMLVAQAQYESLEIVSSDKTIAQYVETVW